jgi:DNA uptake protein ComE-like DNA-binding protein
MKYKLITGSIVSMLALSVACDRQGNRQEEQLPEGEVIERSSRVIEQGPADVQEQTYEKGSEDVEYTTKREVTETIQREQEIPTVETTQKQADINEMEVRDFRALGFDQQSAQRIVETREQRGRFNSVDELQKIEGVSSETFNRVRDSLGVAPRQAEEE